MSTNRSLLALEEFADRTGWLINLRWIACGCLLLVILASRFGLGMRIAMAPLLLGNSLLILLNVLYYHMHWTARRRVSLSPIGTAATDRSGILVKAQIWTDLTLLAFLLHYAGGFENPFVLFFVFHVAIAGVLLSRRMAYLAATFAVLLTGIIAAAERNGLLMHYHLAMLHPQEVYSSGSFYLPAVFLVFAATLYIVVYISTRIAEQLRTREYQLAQTNAELLVKDKVKSEYVRTVSHDIRGSLAAIQSCLRVVIDGITGSVSPKSGEMIGRAERRSRTLLHFVDELFYLSAVRAEPPGGREVEDLVEIARTVVDKYEPIARAKGLELILNSPIGPARTRLDRGSVEQLLTALLDNAVRYTGGGGTVVVGVELSESKREIQVTVSDNGRGIPEVDFPNIFDDFFTGSNIQDIEPRGTGLGLPIARSIASIHGSEIQARSGVGQGSRFGFSLPIQIEEDGGYRGDESENCPDRR